MAGLPSVERKIQVAILSSIPALEWRNWQTHGTQNPATFTGHEGSTPSSSTINFQDLRVLPPFPPNPLRSHLYGDLYGSEPLPRVPGLPRCGRPSGFGNVADRRR